MHVSVRRINSHVEVVVADTGPGIPAAAPTAEGSLLRHRRVVPLHIEEGLRRLDVYAERRRRRRAVVDSGVTGDVLDDTTRETALRIARDEAARVRPDVRIVDTIVVRGVRAA